MMYFGRRSPGQFSPASDTTVQLLDSQDLVCGPISLRNVREGPLPTTFEIAGIRAHNKTYLCP